jgi:hypothetical protein
MKRSTLAAVAIFLMAMSHVACAQQVEGDAEIAAQMAKATKDHEYDKAVQIGLNALKSKPSDGLLLSQVSLVYLQRAIADKENREHWLDRATDYANRSFNASPLDGLNTFNAARAFESAGDFSPNKKCSYYARSIQLFDGIAPHSNVPEDGADKGAAVIAKRALEGRERVGKKSEVAACGLIR